MATALPLLSSAPVEPVPTAPFVRLTAVWIQLTGTWCNLECTHCLNASGPRDPWLRPLDPDTVRRALREAEALGAREIYFTGGEPFLHPQILPLLAEALAVAPTTVLTNGTRITEDVADALADLAAGTPYSLEVRVSLDDVDREANDRVRGAGAWDRAVAAIRRLDARKLLPIVTATEIGTAERGSTGMYDRFRTLLLSLGIEKPRVKIIPVFAIGRLAERGGERLTEAALEGFDRGLLQCAESRVVADGGVYACPILAGLPGARLSAAGLADAFGPAPLYHPACATCHQTGMSCRNY
jgi:MoaA/NifB/PqqE/SkfB family radical SAM enzyme